MTNFKRYFEAISYLEGLANLPLQKEYVIEQQHADIYIKRMRYFLDLIGKPDRDTKVIHIAGTSGKGTVTNMVHEILYCSGKKVGSFTSPSVVTSIEKIKVNNMYIAPDEFADIVDFLKPYIDKAYLKSPFGVPSYFELFFAIVLIYFQKQKCEWIVLEVGLGGRFDATNAILKKVISAITNIDYDHTEILGKTLEKIAHDKAGIIKKGSVFFTTEQRPRLLTIFKTIAKEASVNFNALPQQHSYKQSNILLASAIAHHLEIEEKYITKGIGKARLMCRFETIQKNPTVILDGAHNSSKIKTTVQNLKKLTYKKLFLIISIAENKDSLSILDKIVPLADFIYFTRFQNRERKCSHPKILLRKSKMFLNKKTETFIYLDATRALLEALKKAKKDDAIVVAGSFYLAGELRKHWSSEELILRKRKI